MNLENTCAGGACNSCQSCGGYQTQPQYGEKQYLQNQGGYQLI